MPKKLELAGLRFGKLLVVHEAGRDAFGAAMWLCKCDCGKETTLRGVHMTSGASASCGCGIGIAASKRNTTHGQSDTPLYQRWRAMLDRTSNPKNDQYKDYGGRGIAVCAAWHSFEGFSSDMAASFDPALELERDNVDGNYEPSNCRWATIKEQQRNKRNNHRLTIGGKTMTVVEWAEKTGLKANTIITRVRRNWPESRLLELANEP